MTPSTTHPTLFSDRLVRTLLDGHKTQTRRVITRHNSTLDGPSCSRALWDALDRTREPDVDALNAGPCLKVWHQDGVSLHRVYPRVAVGDHLWVKEAWAPADSLDEAVRDEAVLVAYRADRTAIFHQQNEPFYWRTDDWSWDDKTGLPSKGRRRVERWRPSIHLPKWASRITLEVTRVRAERVQAITEEDAAAEGLGVALADFTSARYAFRYLWDAINAKRGLSWESNPWVWAYDFRKVGNDYARA